MTAPRDILLDTGPLIAILDHGDPHHRACADLWPDVAERCITTDAVVTEATHLVGRAGSMSLPLELLLAARIPVVSLGLEGQEHAVRLMRRYGVLPMDYADATLVIVGDLIGASTVFTLDKRGFQTYRRGSGAPFTLLPQP